MDVPRPNTPAQRVLRVQALLLVALTTLLVANLWLFGRHNAFSFLTAPPTAEAVLDPAARPRVVTPATGGLGTEEQRTIDTFEAVRPSVVGISPVFLAQTLRGAAATYPEGTGSGFVWDARGWIVTNWHVVESASMLRVHLAGDVVREAVVVGGAPEHDLAVIKIDPVGLDLVPVALGRTQDLRVGQTVLAIGNPFGLEASLSRGIVSGLDRTVDLETGVRIEGAVQTDAAINPGNSGGVLLDLAGRLVGVNTAISSGTGENSGVGFAIPTEVVNRVVPEIITGKHPAPVGRALIGILMQEDAWMEAEGLTGVGVRDLVPGGGAEAAGLRSEVGAGPEGTFDRILAVEGTKVRRQEDLRRVLEAHRPGEQVTLEIARGDEVLEIEVTLGGERLRRPR